MQIWWIYNYCSASANCEKCSFGHFLQKFSFKFVGIKRGRLIQNLEPLKIDKKIIPKIALKIVPNFIQEFYDLARRPFFDARKQLKIKTLAQKTVSGPGFWNSLPFSKSKQENQSTPTPWLTRICFTRISLTWLFERTPIPHLTCTVKQKVLH